MAWTPLFLLFLPLCSGSPSQPVLTRPPSLLRISGNDCQTHPHLSSGFSVGDYSIFWYQQQPGSPPRDLLYYSSDSEKHQGSGVPSRFSGSKDASANAGLLRISGLQAEAEADHHCALYHYIGNDYHYS